MTKMKLNLPNQLTLIRIIMVPIFMFFLFVTVVNTDVSRIIAASIFLIAAFTDFVDGKIARSRNLITNFGKFLDPLADKFLIFGAIIAFCGTTLDGYFDEIRIGIIISGTIVIFRELAVTSIRLVAAGASKGVVIAASWLGKTKTFSQCVFVMVVILEPIVFGFGNSEICNAMLATHTLAWIAMTVMTLMTIWSGVDYLKTYWAYLNPNE